MFISQVKLQDFRSYSQLDVEFAPGVNILLGRNGQGKTNVVEALEYLATLKSHRVSSDLPLVRYGCDSARVQARVQAGVDDSRSLLLDLTINSGRANRAQLNRAPCRPRDLIGALKTVIFSPEDLAIVKGDPGDRRRFIDEIVVLRWPRIAGVRSDYDKVLRQRNTLLKSLDGYVSRDSLMSLEIWDEALCRLGGEIMAARIATLSDIADDVSQAYRDIAPTNNEARAVYESSVSLVDVSVAGLSVAMAERIAFRRDLEVRRGVTLVGPQRDDIDLRLGDLPAKGYASHGESWSFALALRLGAYQLVKREHIEPVLILDDVFAELDSTRRHRLSKWIRDSEQVIITAAAVEDIPVTDEAKCFLVRDGSILVLDSLTADAIDGDESG